MATLTNRISNTLGQDTWQVALTVSGVLFFGVGAVSVSLCGNGTVSRGLLWAGAWSSVGWFLGFLFGIPRYLSTDTVRTPAGETLEKTKQELAKVVDTAKARRFEADTNARALADAEATANTKAQAASQAANAATQAAAQSAANPHDQKLKNDSDSAIQTASIVKLESDEASELAKDAAVKAREAEAAAGQADTAVENAMHNEATVGSNAAAAPRASLTVNTNLEQISDWLTKIIVGVSLVESQSLLTQMRRAVTLMTRSIAKTEDLAARMNSTTATPAEAAAQVTNLASYASVESVAYAIMMYFLVTGLLGSYLLTRLFLQRAFDNAATGGSA
jgi:hypothetical protein